MLDLKRKTELRVFQLCEACKLISLDPVLGQTELAFVMELFLGLRAVNLETEKIVHRLRLDVCPSKK